MHFARLSALIVVAGLASRLYAQATGTTAAPSPVGSKSVPVNVLYVAFFGHVTRLDNTAAALQRNVAAGTAAAGAKPSNLTGYYKSRLRLTDGEDASLHSVAAVFDAAVKQKDEAAKIVIKNLREQLRSAKSSSETPQVPRQLIHLQTERDAIISSHINLLKAQMGASGFQKVDTFVNTAFAIHASTQAIDPAVTKAAADARLAKTESRGQKSVSGTKPSGLGRKGIPKP